MYGVDTISLVLNFRNTGLAEDVTGNAEKMKIADWKIQSKLHYDKENLEKLNAGRNDVAMKGQYNGYSFFYNCEWHSLTVTAPHFKIEKYTDDEIIANVKEVIMNYFELEDDKIPEIYLSRLDIKNDYLCNPSEDLKIIKNILFKARCSFRFYTKKILRNDDKGFLIKYNSSKKNNRGENYEVTRQEFQSFNLMQKKSVSSFYDLDENTTDDILDENGNYIEYAFYDKSEEIRIKVARGKADESEIKRYKNIFRSEIRIKNGRLNSNKFENSFMTKELQTYYNEEMSGQLYDKYIKDILGTKDFYRIDVAVAIVQESKFTPKKRQALEDLLLLVNKLGYTPAESIWIQQHSKATLYNHIHALEDLGINILTFDVTIDDVTVNAEKLVNFSQRSNGVKEI